jgi:hypothetical protein
LIPLSWIQEKLKTGNQMEPERCGGGVDIFHGWLEERQDVEGKYLNGSSESFPACVGRAGVVPFSGKGGGVPASFIMDFCRKWIS